MTAKENELKAEIARLKKENNDWTKDCGNAEPTPFEDDLIWYEAELKGYQEAKAEMEKEIRTDRFFKHCPKCKETIETTEDYRAGFKRCKKQFLDAIDKRLIFFAKNPLKYKEMIIFLKELRAEAEK